MRTIDIEITVRDMLFDVNGVYNKPIAGDREQPDEGGDFEVHNIFFDGVNVNQTLDIDIQDEIYSMINENIQDYI